MREPTVESSKRMSKIPQLVLWAWERPEDLRFIESKEVGVAFLAKTIVVRSDRVLDRIRLQPLHVNPNTPVIGVIRIESSADEPSAMDSLACDEVVANILQVAEMKRLSAIQIDYDARVSERDFYRRIVQKVRRQLPDSMGLSITALASWCIGDRWLEDLPIDEAVPMLFRMGADHDRVMHRLSINEDFKAAMCNGSIGISMDEFPQSLPIGRRVYVFNPQSWSRHSYTFLVEKMKLQ